MMKLISPTRLWQEAREHFFGDGHYGFFLAAAHDGPAGPRMLLHRFLPIDPADHEGPGEGPRVITLDALLDVINEAKRTGLALVECHVHATRPGGVGFSTVDHEGLPEFAEYVLDSLPGRPYAALVIDRDSVDGLWWTPTGQMRTITGIRLMGAAQQALTTTSNDVDATTVNVAPRYNRQALDGFLGKAGQAALENSTVAVVGLGGLGSHEAQQLAHLGIRRLILIDADRVEETNLNRLVGARKRDVGKAKVRVAKRQAQMLRGRRRIKVECVRAMLPEREAVDAVLEADLVLGCVDNDGARLTFNRLARAYHLPYIDASSGIEPDDEGRFERAGGKVAAVMPGEPCLQCMRVLDMAEARHFLSPESVREDNRRHGYVEGWDDPDPAVISLNGVVASMAVNEALLYLAALRPTSPLTLYYMRAPGEDFQKTTRMEASRDPQCYACSLSGVGDQVLETLIPNATETNHTPKEV